MKIKSTKERQKSVIENTRSSVNSPNIEIENSLKSLILENKNKFPLIVDLSSDISSIPDIIKQKCEGLNLTYETYRQKIGENINNYIDKYPNSNMNFALQTPFSFFYFENRFNGFDWYYYDSNESFFYHNQWNWGSILASLHVYSNMESGS